MASIRTFTWGNPGFTDLPFGLRQAVFAVGDAADPHHATFVITEFPPSCRTTHTTPCSAMP